MNDVFLSYAREDRSRAEQLVDILQGRGLTVFWDSIIQAGASWPKALEREIEHAACVVVLWSSSSLESDWVLEEAVEGKRREILLPVLIEAVTPPFGFRTIQAADLVDWNGDETTEQVKKLYRDILLFVSGDARVAGAIESAIAVAPPPVERVPATGMRSEDFSNRFYSALKAEDWEPVPDVPPSLDTVFRKDLGLWQQSIGFVGVANGDDLFDENAVGGALEEFFGVVDANTDIAELMKSFQGLLLLAFDDVSQSRLADRCLDFAKRAIWKRIYTSVGVYDRRTGTYFPPQDRFGRAGGEMVKAILEGL